MKRYKLGFGNKTALEQIAISRRVANGIARLPAEHRQALEQHSVAECVAAAEAVENRVGILKAELRAALAGRSETLRTMRGQTANAALGLSLLAWSKPEVRLTTGLSEVKARHPVGMPAAPSLLRVVSTDFEGRVRLRWKRPVRRCLFLIQTTTDRAARTGWKQAAISGKQTCDVAGLASGRKYWFRVAASNTHGQGPWSQPVSARVK